MFRTKFVEKIKTHTAAQCGLFTHKSVPVIFEPPSIYYSLTFCCFENRAVYEIMWKNTVQPDRPQTTIWRMRIACWIPEATNAHAKYVIVFSTATMVVRTRLSFALCAYCLSCYTRNFDV